MLTKKSYWEWDEKYNTNKFCIGKIVDNKVFSLDLEFDRENEKGEKWYKIKDVPFTNICINHENEIIRKAFYRDGREDFEIEKVKIKGIFMKEVHDHLHELLLETDEFYEGRKLTVAFGDWIIGAAFLD